jgi:hypothetical protein
LKNLEEEVEVNEIKEIEEKHNKSLDGKERARQMKATFDLQKCF